MTTQHIPRRNRGHGRICRKVYDGDPFVLTIGSRKLVPIHGGSAAKALHGMFGRFVIATALEVHATSRCRNAARYLRRVLPSGPARKRRSPSHHHHQIQRSPDWPRAPPQSRRAYARPAPRSLLWPVSAPLGAYVVLLAVCPHFYPTPASRNKANAGSCFQVRPCRAALHKAAPG